MKPRHIATSLQCFVHKDGKYLMLHRSSTKRIMPGVWMAPGGKREFAEGLFECAHREILEETGLRIQNIQIKATGNAYMEDLDQELFFHLLTAEYASGTVKEEVDNGELVWLTPQEIMKLPNILAELPHVLHHVFSKNKEAISYRAIYSEGNTMREFSIES